MEKMLYAEMEAARLQNAAIQTPEVYESNLRVVNDIVLAVLGRGEPLTDGQIAALEAIVWQCPYSAGPAIYTARSLYALVNEDALYDDEGSCLQIGQLWRPTQTPVAPAAELNLVPNPASHTVVLQGLAAESVATVILFDALGREALRKQVGPADVIDIEHLATGLYAWCVMTDEGTRQSGVLQITNH